MSLPSMQPVGRLLAAAGLLVVLGATPAAADPPGWKLTWQDEFDGDRIDPAKWGRDLGNGSYNYEARQWIGGWGNDELQYYTRDPDNAFVKDGMLHIRALKESIDGFHVYAVEWQPGEIHWEVDGTRYASMNFWWSTSRTNAKGGVAPAAEADLQPWPAPFDRPFQILMNLAVGGKFLGNPDATTPFPAEMLIDYVRVYERTGGPAPLVPRGPGRLPFAPAAR